MKIIDWERASAETREDFFERPAARSSAKIADDVAAILSRVREAGDVAVRGYSRQFDHCTPEQFEVDNEEAEAARATLTTAQLDALDTAIQNVTRFHEAQMSLPLRTETTAGIVCERLTRPIGAVGLYVPAGSAPLPSTAIMLGIPAAIAGCPSRILLTPPRADGYADPGVVVAARMCGIERIFKIGGAQAVAALAFGTESVPAVDKIFGPGNNWVTEAKRQVGAAPRGPAIDMGAGPSELLVIADEGADPSFVAADMLSQAEHDVDAQVTLLTPSTKLCAAVAQQIDAQAPLLPRSGVVLQALNSAAVIVVRDLPGAVQISNRYAPEHLSIQTREPRALLSAITAAGSVFLGRWSPEAVGDYTSGTNHVLPTSGAARAVSGLGIEDFQVRMSVQTLSRQGLASIAPATLALARMEGLEAHARAVEVRLHELGRGGGA